MRWIFDLDFIEAIARHNRLVQSGLRFPALTLSLTFFTFWAGLDRISAEPIATFEIARDGDLILLPVTVAGMEHRFVLDSGSTHHVFDSSLRQHMSKHVRSTKIGTGTAVKSVEVFVPPPVTIGTLPLNTRRNVLVANLLSIRQSSGENVSGILGIDFFRDHVIQFDSDSGKLNVFETRDGEGDWGTPIKVEQDKAGRPSIRADVGNIEGVSLLVDTAQTGGIAMAGYLFRHLQATNELSVLGTSHSVGFVQISTRSLGCLNKLQCGPFTHTRVSVQSSDTNTCGMAYLSRYKVTFDLANNLLYLKPGIRYGQSIRRTTTGLSLLLVNQEVVVESVKEESSAAQCGIQPGDIITHVDDVPASTLGLQAIRRRQTHSHVNVVMLRLRRSEREFNVRVELSVLGCGPSG